MSEAATVGCVRDIVMHQPNPKRSKYPHSKPKQPQFSHSLIAWAVNLSPEMLHDSLGDHCLEMKPMRSQRNPSLAMSVSCRLG